MAKQGLTQDLQEAVAVFLLAVEPPVEAAITLAWPVGLVLGLFAVMRR